MTREAAKELMPIIQAYAEGKDIEMLTADNEWIKAPFPIFTLNPRLYRIKPEPKYRPFETKEECWNEMHKHPDFGWLIRIDTGVFANIKAIFSKEIVFDNDFECVYTFKDAFKYYKFTDGTTFGSKLPTNL